MKIKFYNRSSLLNLYNPYENRNMAHAYSMAGHTLQRKVPIKKEVEQKKAEEEMLFSKNGMVQPVIETIIRTNAMQIFFFNCNFKLYPPFITLLMSYLLY